ncbi:MAG: hypothetical protein FWD57_16940 [Polyangiaceae bacterium]|nr:hypothetical protein [Polyangiaceae bacterium]
MVAESDVFGGEKTWPTFDGAMGLLDEAVDDALRIASEMQVAVGIDVVGGHHVYRDGV